MSRILCIDDEPHLLRLKCAILEEAGHEVTPATSAHEAIEMMNAHQYHAVVTDWRLGDGNGGCVVLAAKIHSTMPVVVVSGYIAEAYQSAEPLAGFYLEKPVNPEELVTVVNELMKAREGGISFLGKRPLHPHGEVLTLMGRADNGATAAPRNLDVA